MTGIKGELYDLHVHSQYSHDSSTPVADNAEAALAAGLCGLAITDHFDVQWRDSQDELGRIATSYAETDAVARAYAGRLHVARGVEVGEGIWDEDYVEELLSRHDFDLVIGSVHAVRYRDLRQPYSRIDFSRLSDGEVASYLRQYFDDLLEMTERLPCDIVAHLTCPVRYLVGRYQRSICLTDYAEPIEAILRAVIRRQLSLEVNTSLLHTLMPEDWILRRYRELGGERLTLGSDAHIAGRVAVGFDRAIATLRQLGFTQLCCFERRVAIPYPLPEK